MNAKRLLLILGLSATIVASASIEGLTDLTNDTANRGSVIGQNFDTGTFGSPSYAFNITTEATQASVNNDGTDRRFGGKATSSSPLRVKYTFTTNVVINAYRIWNQVANYSPDMHAPKVFYFEGSFDGSKWETLDDQSNQTGWKAGEPRVFEFSNKVAYKYYRMNFTANNGEADGYVIIQELEYFCRPIRFTIRLR